MRLLLFSLHLALWSWQPASVKHPPQSGCSAVNTFPVKPLRLAVGRQKSIKKSLILIEPISVMEKHVLDCKCQARVHPALLVTFLKIPVMG